MEPCDGSYGLFLIPVLWIHDPSTSPYAPCCDFSQQPSANKEGTSYRKIKWTGINIRNPLSFPPLMVVLQTWPFSGNINKVKPNKIKQGCFLGHVFKGVCFLSLKGRGRVSKSLNSPFSRLNISHCHWEKELKVPAAIQIDFKSPSPLFFPSSCAASLSF